MLEKDARILKGEGFVGTKLEAPTRLGFLGDIGKGPSVEVGHAGQLDGWLSKFHGLGRGRAEVALAQQYLDGVVGSGPRRPVGPAALQLA